MRARVDLHFHLIPAVDDGPATIEETVELARAAVADHTGAIVATPHVRHDFLTDVRELPDRLAEVRGRLATERVPIRVLGGAELGPEMVGRLGQTDLDTVAVGPPGARWLLLETPFEGIDDVLLDAADELRNRGFGVVLAHPERSAGVLADDGADLRRERSRGTAVQVNASSLTGAHGREARAAAVRLVRAGLADVVASDAHSRLRGPALERGFHAMVRQGVSGVAARHAVDLGPARLARRGLRPRVTVSA